MRTYCSNSKQYIGYLKESTPVWKRMIRRISYSQSSTQKYSFCVKLDIDTLFLGHVLLKQFFLWQRFFSEGVFFKAILLKIAEGLKELGVMHYVKIEHRAFGCQTLLLDPLSPIARPVKPFFLTVYPYCISTTGLVSSQT